MPAKKTEKEIEIMAESGKILAGVMQKVVAEAKVGVTLLELDALAFKLIKEAGAEPAFLHYRPEGARTAYPATICASVNELVVHGIPNSYAIKDGDLVKLDFGVRHKGYCSDAAMTVGVGNISEAAKNLIEATRGALLAAIKEMIPGSTLGDIGATIEQYVARCGFKVIYDLTGHGIGKRLHEEPSVYNYGTPGEGMVLEPGMVFALEPITSPSTNRVRQTKDDAYVTSDGSISAHFEHTVVVTHAEPRILTML